jgi:hypothetical protein
MSKFIHFGDQTYSVKLDRAYSSWKKKSHKLFPAGINYYNKFHVGTQDVLLMKIADAKSPLLDTTR